MGAGRQAKRREGGLNVRRLFLVAFAALLVSAPVRAQTAESAFPGVPFVFPPTITYQPEIGFPTDHILRKVKGLVVVAILVGEDGAPLRHRIVSAEPPLIFDRYVTEAVPDFRFGVATRNGKPLAYETRLTMNFAPGPNADR